MTWTFSAEEWLVDFTSAPRGTARAAGFLDPVDQQTCALLTWPEVAPQLVMPSIVPKRAPAASPPPAAPVATPPPPVASPNAAPLASEQGLPPPPPSGVSLDDDDDDRLEIELTSPPAPSAGVFIPTLTRAPSAPMPAAAPPELEIGLPADEPANEPARPIADDLFDEDDGEDELPPPPAQAEPQAAVSGVIGGVLDDDDDDVLEVDEVDEVLEDADEVLEEAEEVLEEAEEVLEEAEEVLEDADEVLEEADEVLEEVEEESAKPPPAPPIPPPSPRTPPPVSRPPPRKPAAAEPAAKPRGKRKKKKQWYDEVFADHYAYIMPRDAEISAELDVKFMIESAQLNSENRILDVGCGDGRHLFGFAKEGYADVTGLDMSLSQLVAGSRKNVTEGAGLTFLYGDMRDLPTDETYDVVTCLGGTFGYFEDDQNRACLQQMVERLAPGGKLIIQVMNRDHMMGIVPCRSWWQGRSCLVLDVAEMNFFSNRLKVHRTIVFEDGRQFEHHIHVRAYSVNELGKMITGLGMRVLEVSGSRATRGRFFGGASPDVWICAQRKD